MKSSLSVVLAAGFLFLGGILLFFTGYGVPYVVGLVLMVIGGIPLLASLGSGLIGYLEKLEKEEKEESTDEQA